MGGDDPYAHNCKHKRWFGSSSVSLGEGGLYYFRRGYNILEGRDILKEGLFDILKWGTDIAKGRQ